VWKEPKIKQGLKEVPLANWPMVDIKKQDVMFFAIVRKLKTFGLDPKSNLENKHVITMECWFLFGGFKKFKMKSPSLRLGQGGYGGDLLQGLWDNIYYKL
jgi:hypothetical protein